MSNDDTKTIYCTDGTPIPWLEKHKTTYLDRSSFIFGGSRTGKSTIIEEIMYLCKDDIPNILVIAPITSRKNYLGKVDPRCIKENMTRKMIDAIWERQMNVTQIYQIANNMDNLSMLFKRSNDSSARIKVLAINQYCDDKIKSIESDKSLDFASQNNQVNLIIDMRDKKIKEIYKEAIRDNRSMLSKQDLTKQELVTLEYLDFNPRFMLIIDDCSEYFPIWIKYYKKTEANIFSSILFKCRHNFMTLVVGMHDDKLVDTELRKNIHNMIYSSSAALVASLTKQSSGYTPQEKKEAMRLASRVYGNEKSKIKTHLKLCYIREDPTPFHYTIANLYPNFRMGCNPLGELIKLMPRKEERIDENPYVSCILKQKKD